MKRQEDFFNLIGKDLSEWWISKKQEHMTKFLLREWSLASSLFGKVVLINGISCSGKTTLASYLEKFGYNKISYDDICRKIALDHFDIITHQKVSNAEKLGIREEDIIKIVCNCYKVDKSRYSILQIQAISELEESMIPILNVTDMSLYLGSMLQDVHTYNYLYDSAREYIFSGRNVVIDAVMFNKQIDFLSYTFRYYPISINLVYSPLVESLKKCFTRNDFSLENDLLNYKCPEKLLKNYCVFYKFIEFNCIKKPLEIVDKNAVKCILPEVITQTLKHKSHFLDDESVTDFEYTQIIQRTIDRAISVMKLDDVTDTVVMSGVRYDRVIRIVEMEVTLDSHLCLIGSESLDDFLFNYFS